MAKNPNHSSPQEPNKGANTYTAPATPYDSAPAPSAAHIDMHEAIRRSDPASDIMDLARNLRTAAYENGYSAQEADEIFNDDANGRPGGFELLKLSKELRDGNRGINQHEKDFIEHMRVDGRLDYRHARVDFDAFLENHSDLSPEDAEVAATFDMILDLEAQKAAATDPNAQKKLEPKIEALKKYIQIIENPLAPRPDNVNFEQELLRSGFLIEDVNQKDPQGSNPAAQKVKADAQAAHKAVKGRLDQEDMYSKIAVDAYKVIGEKYGKEPDQQAASLPEDQRLEYVAANDLAAEIDSDEKEKLEVVRAKIAAMKGRGAFRSLTRSVEDIREEKQLEVEYRRLTISIARREHAAVLSDPRKSADKKRELMAQAVILEQAKLRAMTNENLKNTAVAKACRFIGRHKILVIGSSVVLAPLTAGVSLAAGAALGGGIVMGATLDEKFRGLRDADKALNVQKLTKDMDGDASMAEIYDRGAKEFDRDRAKETIKRALCFGGGSLTFMLGAGLLPSNTVVDQYLIRNAAAIRPWVFGGIAAGGALKARKFYKQQQKNKKSGRR
jgi:hypothetical protein